MIGRGATAWTPLVLALAAVLLAVLAWTFTIYNRLVQARASVDAQWAQVEVQYQRRVGLVPALVAAVQGFLTQERSVLEAVAQARTAYLAAPAGSPGRARAAVAVEGFLGRLIAVVEASPELWSSETVARLMDELAGTENRLAVERRRYNERVRKYNTMVQQFPDSLVAARAGFEARPYFELAAPPAAPPFGGCRPGSPVPARGCLGRFLDRSAGIRLLYGTGNSLLSLLRIMPAAGGPWSARS